MTTYPNKKILMGNDDFKLDKDMTFGQVIDFAIQNNCPLICKAGPNAMWYLKGKNTPYEDLKTRLDQAEPRHRDGSYSILIQSLRQ